ncbi:hypothetical protein HMPREF0620_1159 [Parascardovia denticolens DSM 10105 = JCM 12538]|uniref:Uncharacterized protein n=1 Tax=Parascardovia denticolens DSM 10105 = JCM 12538 TaxID=864564 RepID=E6K042_PARDN|nr:hypothetical protein HMPREF0620_1159 [Parascardovia denticolens DSM 10105 = JCM 12538]
MSRFLFIPFLFLPFPSIPHSFLLFFPSSPWRKPNSYACGHPQRKHP